MAHKVRRLSKDILSKPQLITPDKFQEIAEYFETRNSAEEIQLERFERERQDKYGDKVEGNEEYGVIKIYGPLCYRMPTGIAALCGDVTSYEGILSQAETLCKDPNLKNIVLDVSSSGGEAYRCFSSARNLRSLCDEHGKRLIAYIDGVSASAAYALTSAAHEVVINPDGEAGSIGVVIRLMNQNKAMKEAGIETRYIHAGASKIPFDEEGEFRDEFLEDLQKRVNKLYGNFIDHVASMRGIDPQVVKDTEAKMFDAEEALSLGLVDAIMEADEFKKKYLVGEQLASPSKVSNTNKDKQMSQENLVVELAEVEALRAELATLKQEKLAAQLKAKTDEITAQLSGAEFLTNLEGVVSFMVGAEDAQAELVKGIISDAQAKLVAQKEEATLALSELTAQYEEKLAAASELNASLEADKESIIEEFAKPQATRKVEKEENTQELTFEQKLARSVEQAKSKANL
jgi:signal peptide peptidase SppA